MFFGIFFCEELGLSIRGFGEVIRSIKVCSGGLMGYESIRSLVGIKEKNNISTFIDTDIKTITRENLSAYKKEIKNR